MKVTVTCRGCEGSFSIGGSLDLEDIKTCPVCGKRRFVFSELPSAYVMEGKTVVLDGLLYSVNGNTVVIRLARGRTTAQRELFFHPDVRSQGRLICRHCEWSFTLTRAWVVLDDKLNCPRCRKRHWLFVEEPYVLIVEGRELRWDGYLHSINGEEVVVALPPDPGGEKRVIHFSRLLKYQHAPKRWGPLLPRPPLPPDVRPRFDRGS